MGWSVCYVGCGIEMGRGGYCVYFWLKNGMDVSVVVCGW